ncbi:hypothetical protein D7Z54_18455 [Salibacterium salarium]|uniref:Helix-turn-helix domain-containing protein n=1 Tax=Salibacterium salarium TaxID=284579 RepID=A0A3R9P5Z2_9BACI|nr:helix-turn-helix domain-containing protein [Salibacterium salarium]RSL31960.1 hypothetical protein D7Z54_18455 [Salibacterium salarium]
METVKSAAHLQAAKANSYFSTIVELDRHVAKHAAILQWKSTEHVVLTFLAQHSLTYPGTSWMKVKTIAASVGKCVRTVNYALTALEDKNIIQRISVMREKRGGHSSNIIAILPRKTDTQDHDCRTNTAARPSSQNPTAPTSSAENSTTESFSLEPLKQDKNTYIYADSFATLIQSKWKDRIVRHTSSYMDKVIDTLMVEYEKAQFARKQWEIRKQSATIKVPVYDWLNEPDYRHIEDRTTWLD